MGTAGTGSGKAVVQSPERLACFQHTAGSGRAHAAASVRLAFMISTSSSSANSWLIYGAYGFTGELVARRAVQEGERPILAGRDPVRLQALAEELGLDWRVAALDDRPALNHALRDVQVVAHCAGPFSATSGPMVDACIDHGVHYCDITGEIDVFEAVFQRSDDAVRAGVTLLPGSGFDVVPTDCAAAMAAAALPSATHLEIAFRSTGGVSRGTARSAAESIGRMSLCRTNGLIVDVPAQRRTRKVELASGTALLSAISWGDVSTAFHSTGIGNVTVYTELPTSVRVAARAVGTVVRMPVVGSIAAHGLHWAAGRIPNPTDEAMGTSGAEIWARASTADDEVICRLSTPDGYALTADAVVRIVRRLIDGAIAPGFQTPSTALGAEFVLELDGVTRG